MDGELLTEGRSYCRMLLLGTAGMLAGLLFDTDGIGLEPVLALCRSGNRTGLSAILDSFRMMPASYLGMAFGCQSGIWLRPPSDRATVRQRTARLVATNAWMLASMTLAHWAAMCAGANLPVRAAGGLVLLAMLAGMAMSGILVQAAVQSRMTFPECPDNIVSNPAL